MPRFRLRNRWLLLFAGAIILAICGFCLARSLLPADPAKQGWAAYARGEWDVAVEHARARLKTDSDNVDALRLLARASVRLGRDDSALAVFGRIGPGAMAADDLCLLGIALTRSGNSRGLEVWEQTLAVEPDHAETLFVLTQTYYNRDRLDAAAVTGRRLARRPGWEGRAEALIGAIELARNDPEAALEAWSGILTGKPVEKEAGPPPIVPPAEVARALLQTHQPRKARSYLVPVLASKPEPEGFWLLSRAFLQEGSKDQAIEALEKSATFRDENPLVPEPSRYVGSNRCAECHSAISQSQQASRHAHTFFPATELGNLSLPPESFADPAQAEVKHTIRRSGSLRLEQETHAGNQVYSAVVEYAFGSGDRGLTLVGRGEKGQAFELRLSHYRTEKGTQWDVTSGHILRPDEPERYLGEALPEDAVRRCLICHVTNAQAILKESGPGASDHGIGCEKCHGPGENHLSAVTAGFSDMAIIDPRMASGPRVVGLCAECHSPRRGAVSREDPNAVRFQGTTLTWSRCFLESQDKLDCITCHDPHRNAVTQASHYEAKCLSCHSGAARARGAKAQAGPTGQSEPSRPAACPVNPSNGCVACHMPSVKNVVPHSSFTDHFIRVHRD
jgi:tetratricopeptide (TPR) repeat protein